jgi:hypothetical protein
MAGAPESSEPQTVLLVQFTMARTALFLALLLAALLAAPASADLPNEDPRVVRRELREAKAHFEKRDAESLKTLFGKATFMAQPQIALYLGRLDAKEMLPTFEGKDKQLSRFACRECGEFGVAAILLQQPDRESEKAALLKVATTNPRDPKAEYVYSVINVAGRELAQYGGDDVIKQLAPVNNYGAQYTVLKLRVQNMKQDVAIQYCVRVLEKHETPLTAEAAQELLTAFGEPAVNAVRLLRDRTQPKIDLARKIDVRQTVVSRCNRILEEIKQISDDDAKE